MPARAKLARAAVCPVWQNVRMLVDEPLRGACCGGPEHNLEVVLGERLDCLVEEPPLELASRRGLNQRPHELANAHVLDADLCHLPGVLIPNFLWPVLRIVADTDGPVPFLDWVGGGGSGLLPLATSTQAALEADWGRKTRREGEVNQVTWETMQHARRRPGEPLALLRRKR